MDGFCFQIVSALLRRGQLKKLLTENFPFNSPSPHSFQPSTFWSKQKVLWKNWDYFSCKLSVFHGMTECPRDQTSRSKFISKLRFDVFFYMAPSKTTDGRSKIHCCTLMNENHSTLVRPVFSVFVSSSSQMLQITDFVSGTGIQMGCWWVKLWEMTWLGLGELSLGTYHGPSFIFLGSTVRTLGWSSWVFLVKESCSTCGQH